MLLSHLWPLYSFIWDPKISLNVYFYCATIAYHVGVDAIWGGRRHSDHLNKKEHNVTRVIVR